jgi:hypothetical protein
MQFRKAISVAFLIAAIGSHASSRQVKAASNNQASACEFALSSSLNAQSIRWSGSCKNKRANGLGVARLMTGSKVLAIFYGTAFNGAPKAGVIEFIGKDSDGKKSAFELIPAREIHTKDPDGKENGGVVQFINAYDAINGFADTLDKAGNKPSADYYQSKTNDISLYFGE